MSKTAYVLINCDVGKNDYVRSTLKHLQEIKEIKKTYGAYDIIAKVKAANHESLRSFVTEEVRKVDNIRSTLTLPVVNSNTT